MPKYTVFITYGVTVEVSENLTDDNYETVAREINHKAVDKMFSQGEYEVIGGADFEIEEWEE